MFSFVFLEQRIFYRRIFRPVILNAFHHSQEFGIIPENGISRDAFAENVINVGSGHSPLLSCNTHQPPRRWKQADNLQGEAGQGGEDAN